MPPLSMPNLLIHVAAASGSQMSSTSTCLQCPYTVQGHHFTSDFRLIELKGYDIILRTDWISAHSPIGLNLKTRELSITKDGNSLIMFVDEALLPKHLLIGTKKLCQLFKRRVVSNVIVLNNSDSTTLATTEVQIIDEIQSLLQEFGDIFKEPVELPPKRTIDHAIALLDEAKVVNQRPYRLPFHQKNTMEELIKHLLLSNMIRPSISPFSSPIILVKKKDGTWRLCVDYR